MQISEHIPAVAHVPAAVFYRKAPPRAAFTRRAEVPTFQDGNARHRAFAASGGVVDCDELSRLMRGRFDQPVSCLARWIVAREIVSFNAGSQTLFPLFQFELPQMTVKLGVRKVIAELADAFDDEELCEWFVRPNIWLHGNTPANGVSGDVAGVIEAARADRFVAVG